MTTADPRDHLVLVLDIERLDDALAYAERMSPWFGIVKVGYEFYGAAGPGGLRSLAFTRVFGCSPTSSCTTSPPRSSAARARSVGTASSSSNFHAAGGETMLRAGLDGLREGAHDAGHAQPIALAVTVLTSDTNVDALESRMQTAANAGFDGVVCGGPDIALARAHHLRTMVPGIRLPGW